MARGATRIVGESMARGAPLIVIFLGLAGGGANNAAASALLAIVLLTLLGFWAAFASKRAIAALPRRAGAEIIAAAAIVAWALFGAAPVGGALAHPAWGVFGLETGTLSIAPDRVWEGLTGFACPLAAYALGFFCGRARRDWIGLSLSLCAIIFSMFAIGLKSVEGGRLEAGMGSANAAALTFTILLCMSIGRIMRAGRAPGRPGGSWLAPFGRAPASLLALIVTAACLLLTASRGGLVSAAIALAVLAALLVYLRGGSAPRPASLGLPVAIAGILLVLAMLGVGFTLDRLSYVETDAVARATVRDAHWRVFLERPWLGHGFNSFHELNAHYATPENYADLNAVGSVHNIYVQLLEEAGLIGFALFALMLAPSLARALAQVMRRGRDGELAAAVLAAALACLVHGMVDFGLQTPAIAALLAFLLGAFSHEAPAARRAGRADVRLAGRRRSVQAHRRGL